MHGCTRPSCPVLKISWPSALCTRHSHHASRKKLIQACAAPGLPDQRPLSLPTPSYIPFTHATQSPYSLISFFTHATQSPSSLMRFFTQPLCPVLTSVHSCHTHPPSLHSFPLMPASLPAPLLPLHSCPARLPCTLLHPLHSCQPVSLVPSTQFSYSLPHSCQSASLIPPLPHDSPPPWPVLNRFLSGLYDTRRAHYLLLQT